MFHTRGCSVEDSKKNKGIRCYMGRSKSARISNASLYYQAWGAQFCRLDVLLLAIYADIDI